jgi:hypothetical protein
MFNGQTDGRTDGRTDVRTDVHTILIYLCLGTVTSDLDMPHTNTGSIYETPSSGPSSLVKVLH